MIQPYNTNAMDEFRVKRCHRGFIICAGGPEYGGLLNPMFAFDRIEDAAEFIVNHFAIAMEARGGETGNTDSTAEGGDSAARKGSPKHSQNMSGPPHE